MKVKVFYAQVIEFEAIIDTDLTLPELREKNALLIPRWAQLIHDGMKDGTNYPVHTGEYLDLEGVEILEEAKNESSAKAN